MDQEGKSSAKKKRGKIGKPPLVGATSRPLTSGEKAAILLYRANNIGLTEIAKRLNRSLNTVSRFIQKMTVIAKQAGYDDIDVKETLKQKSIDAMMEGLDYNVDPYKRGDLGVKVAKGVGFLEPDHSSASVNFLFNNVPPEMRGRYISLDEGETK